MEVLGRPRGAKMEENHWFCGGFVKVAFLVKVEFLVALGVEKWSQSGPESDLGAHKIGSKNHRNLEVGKSAPKSGLRTLTGQFQVPNRPAGEDLGGVTYLRARC